MELEPTCIRKEIAALLPWYAAKSLSEKEAAEVEQHLTTCASCKKELDHIKWISEGLFPMTCETFPGHINSRILTIYSESKKELNNEVIKRIEDHLSLCRQCQHELEMLNKVNESLDKSEEVSLLQGIIDKIGALFVKPIVKPVYVYVLILSLLYPAWLGLFRKDTGQKRLDEPVNIRHLYMLEQSGQRALGEQANEIVLADRSGVFAFSFVLPVKSQEDNVYQATISNDQNEIVWDNENLGFIDSYGTIIIVCPQMYFDEGNYFLIVTEKPMQTKEVNNKYIFNFKVITK